MAIAHSDEHMCEHKALEAIAAVVEAQSKGCDASKCAITIFMMAAIIITAIRDTRFYCSFESNNAIANLLEGINLIKLGNFIMRNRNRNMKVCYVII